MGPFQGTEEQAVTMKAPREATTSTGLSWSTARAVQVMTTSLRSSSSKKGRIGRSIRRMVRMAFSEGRPSRRLKEPGMRPTPYRRSSNSMVSGK